MDTIMMSQLHQEHSSASICHSETTLLAPNIIIVSLKREFQHLMQSGKLHSAAVIIDLTHSVLLLELNAFVRCL